MVLLPFRLYACVRTKFFEHFTATFPSSPGSSFTCLVLAILGLPVLRTVPLTPRAADAPAAANAALVKRARTYTLLALLLLRFSAATCPQTLPHAFSLLPTRHILYLPIHRWYASFLYWFTTAAALGSGSPCILTCLVLPPAHYTVPHLPPPIMGSISPRTTVLVSHLQYIYLYAALPAVLITIFMV